MLGDEHVVRCSHPACEHRHTRITCEYRRLSLSLRWTEFRAGCLAEPLPIPGDHLRQVSVLQYASYCNIPSYLDFRPWGIFSTGTHAAVCNFMTLPIEALVSTSLLRIYAYDYVQGVSWNYKEIFYTRKCHGKWCLLIPMKRKNDITYF